jgi:hypothetical protein
MPGEYEFTYTLNIDVVRALSQIDAFTKHLVRLRDQLAEISVEMGGDSENLVLLSEDVKRASEEMQRLGRSFVNTINLLSTNLLSLEEAWQRARMSVIQVLNEWADTGKLSVRIIYDSYMHYLRLIVKYLTFNFVEAFDKVLFEIEQGVLKDISVFYVFSKVLEEIARKNTLKDLNDRLESLGEDLSTIGDKFLMLSEKASEGSSGVTKLKQTISGLISAIANSSGINSFINGISKLKAGITSFAGTTFSEIAEALAPATEALPAIAVAALELSTVLAVLSPIIITLVAGIKALADSINDVNFAGFKTVIQIVSGAISRFWAVLKLLARELLFGLEPAFLPISNLIIRIVRLFDGFTNTLYRNRGILRAIGRLIGAVLAPAIELLLLPINAVVTAIEVMFDVMNNVFGALGLSNEDIAFLINLLANIARVISGILVPAIRLLATVIGVLVAVSLLPFIMALKSIHALVELVSASIKKMLELMSHVPLLGPVFSLLTPHERESAYVYPGRREAMTRFNLPPIAFMPPPNTAPNIVYNVNYHMPVTRDTAEAMNNIEFVNWIRKYRYMGGT